MHIGLAGPVDLGALSSSLDSVPVGIAGLGGTPVVSLIHGLLERGHRITVYTLDRGVTEQAVAWGKSLRILVGRYRAQGRARDAFKVERASLQAAIQREPPEVLHAHWTYEFALAALDSGIPTLITVHDAPLAVLKHMPNPYRFVRFVMALSVLRRARHLTCVSPYVAEHIGRYLRYKRDLKVIPNSISDICFRLGDKRHRPQVNALPVFGTVMNGWSSLKNGKVALQAFANVRRLLPSARLLMIGVDFELGGPAHKWASKHNCAEGVEFVGKLAHEHMLETLTGQVTILVHPSLEEACPMTLAEAMALGLPIIAGRDSGGVPFVLGGGSAGVLCDVRSATDLSAAMHSLVTNTLLQEQISTEARRQAAQRFRTSRVAAEYEEAYAGVVRCSP